MFGDWRDFDRAFDMLSRMRTDFDRAYGQLQPFRSGVGPSGPATDVYDTGKSYLVQQEVPGLTVDDIDVTVNQNVLTIRGERKLAPPEGYSVHRRERNGASFSRSFTLPSRVDPEKVKATVRDGVLAVELEKAADVQPRKISVKAS